ncbi:MAG: hypothetical protein Q4B42_07460, partial [Oscillospiraceae bacterium]|nr:hypothetical protein [Oscillospiraceae bacterium]
MINREKLAEGAYFTTVKGPYKRARLSVFLSAPLSRGSQTETALIPFMLERGTRLLPDKTLLGRRLLSLYGADMESDYSQFAYSRVLSAYISGADAGLLPEGERVLRERASLLSELLFDTNAPGGAFEEAQLAIEKEKLRETMRSIINSKREYCFRRLMDTFYGEDLRSMPSDGFEEDLAGIDGA